MPQKAILSRLPLLDNRQYPLSNGQVRTADETAARLFALLPLYEDVPETWEGAFGLCCLLGEDPMNHPVTGRILAALKELESEPLPGNPEKQLAVARAAMAVHEYSMDREILKQLAAWCNRLETGWDQLAAEQSLRVRPGDWMEFWVRLYRMTGLKAVLRLCTRLRATAMDWTTLLQDFSQRQPLSQMNSLEELMNQIGENGEDESFFYTRQYWMNHAECLADAVRYTAWAGVFSGHGMDLSAGEKVWKALRKYHYAICGGTTADVLLAGNRPDRGIYAGAVGAWAEAFAAQLTIREAPWAIGELTRLMFNGLPACLKDNGLLLFQRVNCLTEDPGEAGCFDPQPSPLRAAHVWGRLARGLVSAWKAAVTVAEGEMQLNLPLQGAWACGLKKRPLTVRSDGREILIRRDPETALSLKVFLAETETRQLLLGGKPFAEVPEGREGGMLAVLPSDGEEIQLTLADTDRVWVTETHHQGVCAFRANRLLAMAAEEGSWQAVSAGEIRCRNGIPEMPVKLYPRWKETDGIPADLPVLPVTEGEIRWVPLEAYAETPRRIAMFPRARADV